MQRIDRDCVRCAVGCKSCSLQHRSCSDCQWGPRIRWARRARCSKYVGRRGYLLGPIFIFNLRLNEFRRSNLPPQVALPSIDELIDESGYTSISSAKQVKQSRPNSSDGALFIRPHHETRVCQANTSGGPLLAPPKPRRCFQFSAFAWNLARSLFSPVFLSAMARAICIVPREKQSPNDSNH